jgi:2-dehydro-3-deoxygalactonokinase
MTTPLLLIDWGSTNLRAKLVVDSRVAETRESADGIRSCLGRDFNAILESLCGDWKATHPALRVYMSGMIGSREGWLEAPYVSAPAGVRDLANKVVTVKSRIFGSIHLVPGVRRDDPDNATTDVMRGEETQVAGLLTDLPHDGATVCLPGTHSKWVHCRDGRIESFRTFPTGEAFALLTRDSLIAGSAGGGSPDPASPAFARGLELSGKGGGLLHHLFLGRTEMLADRVAPADLPALISGLLIGHEIREAVKVCPDPPVYLIGDSAAARATARALEWLGIESAVVRDDVHLQGMMMIAALIRPGSV